MRGVLGVEAIAHEHGLDLCPEGCEVLGAHRRPAPEDLFAVRPGGRRQDGDTRPAATRCGQEAGVDLAHRGQEFTGSDEGDWSRSRHAGEHIRACATLPAT